MVQKLPDRKETMHFNKRKEVLLQNNQIWSAPGSVLGPLLFLIYTNDIANALDSDYKLRLFPDDRNVFIVSNEHHNLKQQMTNATKALFRWFEANKLTTNIAKTQYIFKKWRSPQNLKQH